MHEMLHQLIAEKREALALPMKERLIALLAVQNKINNLSDIEAETLDQIEEEYYWEESK